jgi:hypothetical protein
MLNNFSVRLATNTTRKPTKWNMNIIYPWMYFSYKIDGKEKGEAQITLWVTVITYIAVRPQLSKTTMACSKQLKESPKTETSANLS